MAKDPNYFKAYYIKHCEQMRAKIVNSYSKEPEIFKKRALSCHHMNIDGYKKWLKIHFRNKVFVRGS